jgi:hypothetical protein
MWLIVALMPVIYRDKNASNNKSYICVALIKGCVGGTRGNYSFFLDWISSIIEIVFFAKKWTFIHKGVRV